MLRINFWYSYLIVLFSTLIWTSALLADTETTLESGLNHYKSEDYSLALIDWHTLLQNEKYAQSHEVLYNLALTEFKLNDFGASLGHLRKAQALNPLSSKIYKTIQSINKTIEEKDFYQVESESLIVILINWLPQLVFILLFVFLIGLGTFIGLRQNVEERSLWSYLKIYIFFSILSAIPLILLLLQNRIQSQVMATLTGSTTIPMYTAHNTNAPDISSLKVGDSFQILKVESKPDKTNWLAISTSEVPLAWIQTDSFVVYRGKIDPLRSSH